MVARAQAEIALRRCLGPATVFREGQWEAIDAIASKRERVLVVQKTGWGKSLVYFIGTRLLRDRGAGPTLIISPLLALMRDQERMANRLGIRAATLNSSNSEEWPDIESLLRQDKLDLLLVSPERLGNDKFLRGTLPAIPKGAGLLVVDEAHCISDWGHDFRPDYRRILGIVRQLPTGMPILATTATANNRVIDDVKAQLGEQVVVLRGPLTRESLRLQVIRLDSLAERLAWLAEQLPHLRHAGIVYVQTVADAQQVSDWLQHRGIDAPSYYGGLGNETRREIEMRLLDNRVDAVVATTALGMGFDKPDLGFVIHYQRPGSVVACYQQIGRAGRAIPEAHAILLHGRGDEIQEYFIDSAFPAEQILRAIVSQLEHAEDLTARELEMVVNAPYGRIQQALKLLELDGAVVRNEGRYSRTINPWNPDQDRIEAVTSLRRHELMRMHHFTETDECLMQFIAHELDDTSATPCGVCANCAGDALPRMPDPVLGEQARFFLQNIEYPIRPRKMLPGGVYPERKSRVLDPISRNGEGRALALWGDAVWGELIRIGKYEMERFDDALVDAAARLIRDRWSPEPRPTWVTAVPSLTRPRLVSDYAERLAAALDLPYLESLGRRHETAEQKSMQNSAQQLMNVVDAIVVRKDRVLPGAVLLVDDIVDSGWTLMVCGARLRRAGSGPVLPFALAAMPPGKDPG